MSNVENKHEELLACATYEDLLHFMLNNPKHGMSVWFLDLYWKKLSEAAITDDLPFLQPWMARHCDKEVFFVNRKLTIAERALCVLNEARNSVVSASLMARKEVKEKLKSIGYAFPVDDKFPLAKLACVYEDQSAFG